MANPTFTISTAHILEEGGGAIRVVGVISGSGIQGQTAPTLGTLDLSSYMSGSDADGEKISVITSPPSGSEVHFRYECGTTAANGKLVAFTGSAGTQYSGSLEVDGINFMACGRRS